jgi:hypothetical protein
MSERRFVPLGIKLDIRFLLGYLQSYLERDSVFDGAMVRKQSWFNDRFFRHNCDFSLISALLYGDKQTIENLRRRHTTILKTICFFEEIYAIMY